MTPLFSIITVSYNAGTRLQTTLQSILSQTCTDYEVIVKDGASTDGTLKDLSEEIMENEKILLVSEKDQGIYDAMNTAAKLAHGRYLYFLNCGDTLYDSEVLAKVKTAIADFDKIADAPGNLADTPGNAADAPGNLSYNPLLIYGNIFERTTGQQVNANPVMNDFAMYRNLPCHQACFYDRRLFEKRGFEQAYVVRADYEHFLWCHYVAHAQMEYADVVIANYEGGGFSETEKNRAISAEEHRAITSKYMPFGKRIQFQLYLWLTLQPLREKISRNKVTAKWYDDMKNQVYSWKHRMGRKRRT